MKYWVSAARDDFIPEPFVSFVLWVADDLFLEQSKILPVNQLIEARI